MGGDCSIPPMVFVLYIARALGLLKAGSGVVGAGHRVGACITTLYIASGHIDEFDGLCST